MEKYDQRQRRALNIIWTAAEDYELKPDFMAFARDGSPDLYLNTILGLVHKYYDSALLQAFFRELDDSALRDTFTNITWLGLEHCTYGRGLSERPVLAELRRQRAADFFVHDPNLSMQQLMNRDHLNHSLQTARWHEVLGEPAGLLNPWEARLYRALAYDAAWDTVQIIAHTRQLLRDFFILSFQGRRAKSWHFSLNEHLAALLKKFLPVERRSSDELLTRVSAAASAAANGLPPQKPELPFLAALGRTSEAQDRAYIEEHFGQPLFSAARSAQLEQQLCTDRHRGCRLYFTRGLRGSNADTATVRRIAEERERNLAYFQAHRILYQLSIRQLTDRIKNCLAVHQQPIPVRGKTGSFAPRHVWHALKLHDPRVFTSLQEEVQSDFCIDLLLDASASRASHQEIIAAQAYVLAESLRLCGIPLQVAAFCSLRGYTVLQLLQRYDERSKSQNVFNYFAAGWNRDGLALRGMKELMEQRRSTGHILIMLSDVRPNDDHRIPAAGSLPLSYDYAEARAIDDTAEEVRRLRAGGIQVIGLLNGELPGFLPAARKIYGKDFARVKKIDRLADAVGSLLQKHIQSG